jgi:signal transduction histidine kinase
LQLKEGCALLRVSDNGAGIPAEALPRLFDRFYRVDKSRCSATGGSGLGLAICKAIVEAHGGTIQVESQPGKGTEFQVMLPSVS